MSSFGFIKSVFEKGKILVPVRSTRRVLPWHDGDSGYSQGTDEGGKWSCVIDRNRMVVMFD
jgi:hypothetical protein